MYDFCPPLVYFRTPFSNKESTPGLSRRFHSSYLSIIVYEKICDTCFFLMCKAACLKTTPEVHPEKWFFSILIIMNKYFNTKPLACDPISTGNSEHELPLIGGCFIIFLYGLTYLYFFIFVIKSAAFLHEQWANRPFWPLV